MAKAKSRAIIVGLLAAVGVGGAVAIMARPQGDKPKKNPFNSQVIQVSLPPLPPPPPPPPPPPKVEPPPEEEMIEQVPVVEEDLPPDMADASDEAAADLSTGLVGDGPNNFGLTSGKRRGTGSQIGGGQGRGSRWGWYAAKVQSVIAAALREHPSIRSATFSVQVRIWPDRNGRITRSQLVGSSGVTAVDEAIRNQVLLGLQLPDPPPDDMPAPIVLRVTARHP